MLDYIRTNKVPAVQSVTVKAAPPKLKGVEKIKWVSWFMTVSLPERHTSHRSSSDEVHLWAEAVRVEVKRESCRHLWVQVCTLGLELDQETNAQRDQTGRSDEDEAEECER